MSQYEELTTTMTDQQFLVEALTLSAVPLVTVTAPASPPFSKPFGRCGPEARLRTT